MFDKKKKILQRGEYLKDTAETKRFDSKRLRISAEKYS